MGDTQRVRVADAFGGGERLGLGRRPVVPVPLPVEIRDQAPGQLPDVGVQAELDAQVDRRQQRGMFVDEPGEGLIVVGELGPDNARTRVRDGDVVALRLHRPRGGVRTVQVVIEQPAAGLVARLGRFRLVGPLDGVGAEQVVEAEPAGRLLDDEMVLDQLGQQPPDGRHRLADQARRGRERDRRGRMQAEQPEQPGRGRA
jgi:hypothetical protein